MLIVCPAWFLGGFYWHSCNIKSGVYKGRVGGRVVTVLQLDKRHPEAPLVTAICQTSHHTSYKPQQKTKLMCSRWSGLLKPQFLHHLYWLFSVLYGQDKVVWKTRSANLLLSHHCVLISIWISIIWTTKCISLVVHASLVFSNLVTYVWWSNTW